MDSTRSRGGQTAALRGNQDALTTDNTPLAAFDLVNAFDSVVNGRLIRYNTGNFRCGPDTLCSIEPLGTTRVLICCNGHSTRLLRQREEDFRA